MTRKLLILALIPTLFGCASMNSPWGGATVATVATAATFPPAAPFVALASGLTAATWASDHVSGRHEVAWRSWLRHKYGTRTPRGVILDAEDIQRMAHITRLYDVAVEERLPWAWENYRVARYGDAEAPETTVREDAAFLLALAAEFPPVTPRDLAAVRELAAPVASHPPAIRLAANGGASGGPVAP